MNKDEILKKSREQKEDEGIKFINNTGLSYGAIGLSVMFIALVVISMFDDRSNLSILFAMMGAYQGAENIGKYSISKEKAYLVWGVILSAVAMVCLMAYLLIDVLKVIVL